MYEFKIGDEVEVVRKDAFAYGTKFMVTSICELRGPDGEPLVRGDGDTGGWFPSSLKLVCPVGYRPVREDEMDDIPRYGDAWLDGEGLNTVCTPFSTPFRDYHGDGEPWFRPLTTPAVETWDKAKAEEPVVKEHNNWGWLSGSTVCGMNMTEWDARTVAFEYTDNQRVNTFVFKVMGEYSARTKTTWTPNDE